VKRACSALLSVALGLSAAESQTETYSVGIGRLSCAYWVSNSQREAEGRSWALGFWTAYNAANEFSHTVGANTDTEVILARSGRYASRSRRLAWPTRSCGSMSASCRIALSASVIAKS